MTCWNYPGYSFIPKFCPVACLPDTCPINNANIVCFIQFYRTKELPNLPVNANTGPFSPIPGSGYVNPTVAQPHPVPPIPPPHMIPSRSSGSSSNGGPQSQHQQQPIYLSPSSTSNTGVAVGEGDDCSSAFYHEIGTAAESIFPLIAPLPVSPGETGSFTWASIGSVGGVVNLPESG